MKDKIVFFDLDETLMLEKSPVEESFIAASSKSLLFFPHKTTTSQ